MHLLIGEELVLKDFRIKQLLQDIDNYEYETIYLDSYKNDSCTDIADRINMFLNTFDFFSDYKVMRFVVGKPNQLKTVLSRLDDFNDDNKLIIDLRCPEYLVRNIKFEYLGKNIEPELYFKYKDYEKDKVSKFIKKCFNNASIKFESDYDFEMAIDYFFVNSDSSYSFIYHQINKLNLLNKKELKFDDIVFTIGSFPDKNSYRICDSIFKSNSLEELVRYLDEVFCVIDYKMYSSLLSTFNNKLCDYILVNSGRMCRVKANYYTFKDSTFKISNCNDLITKINNLSLKSKKNKVILKEEFILLLLEHFEKENS